jgi:putative transposase
MARLPRFFTKGYPLHIIQRGNNFDPVFASEPDYLYFLDCLERAADENELAIHAYVLMTNHVHLLATPAHEVSAPRTLQSIGRRYSQYFGYKRRRGDTLWEGRYRSTVVDPEAYLLKCMRYIELNPVRARKSTDRPANYPWSSYQGNALGRQDTLLTPHLVYRRLGKTDAERRKAYRQLFRTQLREADIEAIRMNTNRGWGLGNERFRAKIEALSGRRASPLPRGRPPKS